MGGIANFKPQEEEQNPIPMQPSGTWGKRPTIVPEAKELVKPEELVPPEISKIRQELGQASQGESAKNTLDFIFENLRRTNYASANTFDRLYDNLVLLRAEGDKETGIPGILTALRKGNWNLAETAWKGFTREEKKTFSDLAEKAGVPLPKLAGFVGDVALDPLTYIPASWFKSAFTTMGAGKVGKAFEKTELGKAFIPGAGLPEEYYTTKLFKKYELGHTERKILDEIYELRKGLKLETREHLLKIRSLGYDPVATAKEIEGLVLEGKIKADDIYKLNKIADKFDEIGRVAVDEGLISREAYEGMKDSYWPGLAKDRAKLGTPDVIPNFFEKASKGGFYTKHKHFGDVEDFDAYLKQIGIKDGAERDILKLLAYREVAQARHLAKKEFTDLTLNRFGERIPAGSVKVPPEGMGLYLPKGALRIFQKEYLEPNFINNLNDIAEKLKELRIKTEKTVTTKTVTESTLTGTTGAASTGPRARMEGIVRDALQSRGFTEGEANAYINILSTKGKEGVNDIVKTMTEKSEAVRSYVDSLPIETSIIDLDALTEAQLKTIGAVTRRVPTYLLPKEIAKDLNKINNYFIGDEATNKLLKYVFDKPIGVWKSMATSFRLPFHLRNLASNQFLMFQGDVAPHMLSFRATEAGSMQTGVMKRMVINGHEVNKEVLSNLGILGGHGWIGEQSATKFMDELDTILKYGRAKNFNPLNYPQEFGSFIEQNSRIGLFLDQLHKGKTPQEAALQVKKYLFNYDELTPFERNVLKRIIPFYTWWRKNIPLQIEMLATKPGKLATASKGLDALTSVESPAEKKARPEYFDDMGYRKTPDFLNLRTEQGHPLYFHLDMPYNDLLMLDRDVVRQLYTGTTPAKLLIELVGNFKAFPKISPIEKGYPVTAPSYIAPLVEGLSKIPVIGPKIIKEMEIEPIIERNTGLKVLGMNAKWKYAIETMFPVLSEMGRMNPQPIKLEEENAPWRKWSYITGVKITPLNIKMQNQMKQIDKMKKVDAFLERLKVIGRSPRSDEMDEIMKEINK